MGLIDHFAHMHTEIFLCCDLFAKAFFISVPIKSALYFLVAGQWWERVMGDKR